ncbi:MAG: class I SAM-dependent methyltransferase, partial [OM182 bacterium]|nr:class I SAM-dependent methyltransferase [OM182 bacterium]
MTQPNDLPFSQSCENNKQPILAQLESLLADRRHVLEIAGGTGQHAEYFASALPNIRWQSSDIPDNVASLNTRLSLAAAD